MLVVITIGIHTGTCIQICRLSVGSQILRACSLCIRDITMECQQPEYSCHGRFPFVRYHSSLLETAEHGITALGRGWCNIDESTLLCESELQLAGYSQCYKTWSTAITTTSCNNELSNDVLMMDVIMMEVLMMEVQMMEMCQ